MDREMKEPKQVGPIQALALFFRHYATFTGRSSRSEYWWLWFWSLLALVAWILALTAWAFILESAGELGSLANVALGTIWILIPLILGLATIVPGIAVGARRLRDAGLSPYLLFLAFAPFGGLALWIMYALPSKPVA